MPRGGHFALWRPNPQADIYRSRWKRFYKRSYRPRTPMNLPDSSPPHLQPKWGRDANAPHIFPDGIPSPWAMQYSVSNFQNGLPPDAKRFSQKAYEWNSQRFLNPARICRNTIGQDHILRCLDPGRKNGADTGYGRAEVGATWDETGPTHLRNIFEAEAQRSGNGEEDRLDFLRTLKETQPIGRGANAANYEATKSTDLFHSRRLFMLLEEQEIVWTGGQLDLRKMARKGAGGNEDSTKERGHFPYVDEQASLIDDLQLREILRLRHRINRRRHFKWMEIAYQYKRWHQQYLRRRAVMLDEVKARMGVLRQTLGKEDV